MACARLRAPALVSQAEDLLRRQYSRRWRIGLEGPPCGGGVARAASSRGVDVGDLDDRLTERAAMLDDFITAYGQYCWPIESIEDLKLAPFQLLAGEARPWRYVTTSGTWRC